MSIPDRPVGCNAYIEAGKRLNKLAKEGTTDMDPDATLKLIVEAIQDSDYEAAFYATQDLKTWLSKGGALPPMFCKSNPLAILPLDRAINWCYVTMKLCKALDLERIQEIEAKGLSCYDDVGRSTSTQRSRRRRRVMKSLDGRRENK